MVGTQHRCKGCLTCLKLKPSMSSILYSARWFMYKQRVMKPYFREMAVAFALYALLLVASIRFGRPMSDGALRTVVLASPIVGFGLILAAIARHMRRIDE